MTEFQDYRPSSQGQASSDNSHNLVGRLLTIGRARITAIHAWVFIGLASGALTGMVLVADWSGEFTPAGAAVGAGSQVERPYAPGELIIKFRKDLSSSEADDILKSSDAATKSEIRQANVKLLKVPEKAEKKILEILKRRQGVEFVELNEILYPSLVPNDTKYSSQWHLPKISMPAAWDVTQGTSSVIVAIIDTGVDPTHPDLASKLVAGYNFSGGDTNTADVFGHGTKVAGAAAAITNNGIGVAAPAWNNKIMPIKVGSDVDGTASTFNIASGITWAVDNGAKVINISYTPTETSGTIRTAAQYAKNMGRIVIVSAGNCSCFNNFSENTDLVSVGATDSSDNLASFSSRGEYVDLSAPGVGIYTTANGGGYSNPSGTSFSAPITSGVAALLFVVDPSLSPDGVEQILESTADDKGAVGKDTSFGYGRINAESAVKKAAGFPTVTITSPLSGTTASGTIGIMVSASDNVGVTKVELWKDGTLFDTDTVSPYAFSWDTTQTSDGSHSLQAKAYDAVPNVRASEKVDLYVANSIGPVAFWKLDDGTGTKAIDSSGNLNTGTLKNDPVWTNGQEGGALNFDGVNDFVSVPNSSSLNITGNAITISAWVNVATNASYTSWGIVSKRGWDDGYRLIINNANKVNFNLTGKSGYSVTSANAVTLGQWTHIAGVYDGAKMKIYINGVADPNETLRTGPINSNTYRVTLGMGDSYTGCPGPTWCYLYKGLIDNVKIHNRALSQSEIQEEISAPPPPPPPLPSPDTEAPLAAIVSPLSGITASGTIGVMVSASDNVGVTKVELWKDGTLFDTDTVSPYAFSWDTTQDTNTTHSLQAKAYDAVPNIGVSGIVNVTVNNAPPPPPPPPPSPTDIIIDNDTTGTSKTGSWCVSGAAGYYGANSLYSCGSGLDTYRWTPALSASAIYDVSMWWTAHTNRTATAVIKIRDAAGVITTKTVDEKINGGKWNSLGIYTLGPGSYVETTDQNGQVSADAVKFMPTSDTEAPTVTITSPSGGVTVSGTVSVLVSASDGVGVTKVELWKDGTLFDTDTVSPYAFSWDTTQDTNTTHSLQAKAYDAVPNVGVSGIINVNVNQAEIVIDNDTTGTSKTGSWCVSGAAGYYGANSLYSCGSGLDTYRWTPALSASAIYDVSMWWTAHTNRTATAVIKIRDAAGVITTKTVDEKINGGKWNSLGIYTLGPGSYVETNDQNGQVSADAVKFVGQ